MKRIILFIASLLPLLPTHGQENQEEFDRLAADVEFAAKSVSPESALRISEAKKLAEFTHDDLANHRAHSTVSFLKTHHSDTTAWQVITHAILAHDFRAASHNEQLAIFRALFKATIRQGDSWAYYSAPRGGSDPYRFRSQLVREMINVNSGKSRLNIENQSLLQENPNEWLKKYVPEEVSSSPEKSEEGQQSTKAAGSKAAPTDEDPGVTTSKTTPEFPRWTWWTGAGALVMAALAFLLKKRSNRHS